MLNDSLAPIKRASLFFGFMGLAIATLTFGAGLQLPGDQSSTTVEQAKLERHVPTDTRFAAVDPSQRQASPAKRAIVTSQQALLERPSISVLR